MLLPVALTPSTLHLAVSTSNLNSNTMSKYDIEKRCHIDAVKNAYGSYVERVGDGNEVLKLRGETLGYNENFFRACNMIAMMNDYGEETEEEAKPTNNEDEQIQLQLQSIQKLFVAFCGSGCPLRIDGDKHLPKEGDVVVDLGCGAGHDSILAGGVVGPTGRVFGVDFTQAMLDQSQRNVDIYTKESMFAPFMFCRGSIDDPSELLTSHGNVGLKEGIANVVISNGVFNLCTNKSLAFQSAFDLLKPGGKFLLNDVCVVEENPAVTISCTIGDEATS